MGHAHYSQLIYLCTLSFFNCLQLNKPKFLSELSQFFIFINTDRYLWTGLYLFWFLSIAFTVLKNNMVQSKHCWSNIDFVLNSDALPNWPRFEKTRLLGSSNQPIPPQRLFRIVTVTTLVNVQDMFHVHVFACQLGLICSSIQVPKWVSHV